MWVSLFVFSILFYVLCVFFYNDNLNIYFTGVCRLQHTSVLCFFFLLLCAHACVLPFVCMCSGMDQAKTAIGDLPVRVVGAIAHGRTRQSHCFLVTNYSKETNSVVEALRRVLNAQETLPPTLVLQVDNTSQENKNSRMFSFLAALVEQGCFERIIVNFLPVGHTVCALLKLVFG